MAWENLSPFINEGHDWLRAYLATIGDATIYYRKTFSPPLKDNAGIQTPCCTAQQKFIFLIKEEIAIQSKVLEPVSKSKCYQPLDRRNSRTGDAALLPNITQYLCCSLVILHTSYLPFFWSFSYLTCPLRGRKTPFS